MQEQRQLSLLVYTETVTLYLHYGVTFIMQSIQTFLDTVRIYGQPSTVKNYGFWLVKFHEFIQKPVIEVTATDIADWVDILKLKYAPLSVSLAIAVIKEYVGDSNPNVVRRLRRPKAHSLHPSDPLTPEEYVSMLSFIHADTENGVRDCMIIRLLYDTGARVGEIHTFLCNPVYSNKFAIINTEKTGDKRYIYWGEDTDIFLKLWISFNNNVPSIRHIERIVHKYATLAKITEYKKVTPHSFRHTLAHRILNTGGGVKQIQQLLGHKSPISSFHYLNMNEQESNKMAQKYIVKTPMSHFHVGGLTVKE